MGKSHADEHFSGCAGEDPALPGDPWSRLRYHYGQLLGADDFQAEQNAVVLRRRLHNALLHGLGTVCGLRVSAAPGDPPQTRLEVAQGLAVDVYGREIYVDESQCLDVIGLHGSDFWATLARSPAVADEDPPVTDMRRAYVTLCYEACLSNQVPAITPPCGDASEALAFSRVNDRFRIDLAAEQPPDPHALQGPGWPPVADGASGDLRQWLLASLLDYPGDGIELAHLWTGSEPAPLLLAVVDLVHEDSGAGELTRVELIDNSPRALLPAAQLCAEQSLRQRLAGAAADSALKLLTIEDNSAAADATTAPEYTLRFSADLEAGTADGDSVRAYALQAGVWSTPLAAAVAPAGDSLTLTLAAPPASGTAIQIHLSGQGPRPVMAVDGGPLDGWWDEPLSGSGRGRDVSLVRVWTPGAA